MDVISKLSYFLLAAPVIFLLVRYSLLRSGRDRIFIVFFHALLLTCITIFLFNKPFWSWSNQTGLIQGVSGGKENKAAYNYIWDHFILVDNSFDKELIPNPEGDEDDSTTLPITDRKKLAAFFHLLNDHSSNIDLVVGDIGFDLETASDALLQQEFRTLSTQNKLLVSVVPDRKNNKVPGLPENVYGNITEEGAEKLFVTHTIKQKGYYSLPYKLYAYVNGLRTGEPFLFQTVLKETDTVADKTHTINNTFFPDFFFRDEELLKGRLQNGQNALPPDTDAGYESKNHTFYFLSELLSPLGRAEFIKNLTQRRQRGQKNIIFLGTFSSPTEDIHQTIYADLHGPTILLNIFYALHLKRHYLTIPFILILFTGYSIISWVLIYHSLQIAFFSKRQKRFMKKRARPLFTAWHSLEQRLKNTTSRLKKYRFVGAAINIIGFSVEFVFVEALHVVLLITLIFLVREVTGQLINGMSLLVYLTIINALLKYARRYLAPHHSNK